MGLRLLFLFDGGSALEMAARRTDAVRQHRFVTLFAVLNLPGFDVVVASPVALPRVRNPPLGNSHV
jgi:hypothetical protein